jgi:hypothetical protein
MLKKLKLTVFGTAFLCCLSVVAVSDNKDKPKSDIYGCHPILNNLGKRC